MLVEYAFVAASPYSLWPKLSDLDNKLLPKSESASTGQDLIEC